MQSLLTALIVLAVCAAASAQELASLERVRQFNCVCSLIGAAMKQPEVLALLGPPTHIDADGAFVWDYRHSRFHQGHYRVRFGADGTARESRREFIDFAGWHWATIPNGPTLDQLKQAKPGELVADVIATLGPFLRRDPDGTLYWEAHPEPDVQLDLRITMDSHARVGSSRLEEVRTTTHGLSLFGFSLFELRVSKPVPIP